MNSEDTKLINSLDETFNEIENPKVDPATLVPEIEPVMPEDNNNNDSNVVNNQSEVKSEILNGDVVSSPEIGIENINLEPDNLEKSDVVIQSNVENDLPQETVVPEIPSIPVGPVDEELPPVEENIIPEEHEYVASVAEQSSDEQGYSSSNEPQINPEQLTVAPDINLQQIEPVVDSSQQTNPEPKKKKISSFLEILLVLIILGVAGYFAYTYYFKEKFFNKETPVVNNTVVDNTVKNEEEIPKEDTAENKTVDEEVVPDITLKTTDWYSGEFAIDGVIYHLNDSYSLFVENGWSVDWKAYGKDEGYIMNKGDKVATTINLKNEKFDDRIVSVGFINNGDVAKDIKECDIWGISVDNNSVYESVVNFVLPNNIKLGSTKEEIETAYGKPEESNIYNFGNDGDNPYSSYEYTYNSPDGSTVYLTLKIFDKNGLTGFNYKIYS